MNFDLHAVGVVRNRRAVIEDDNWGDVLSTIELVDPHSEEALLNIEFFSHVEVFYVFDRVEQEKIETGARHPRGNTEWPLMGIFAQRGKNRPNRIGATICELIHHEGRTLTVRGLDALDGTPVLDIKPVMEEFLPRQKVRQPEWAGRLMQEYWQRK